MKACSRCGTVAEHDDELPPGWSFETSERGILWMCQACTRENVRAIESKLSEEWW